MRTISLPELTFSNWYQWNKRNQYSLRDYPGVYLISITDKPDLEGREPTFEDVVYIGMTNSRQGLKGRWQQFANAISGKRGHSGGNTIFRQKGHNTTWQAHLYVAAMGIRCDVRNPTDQDYLTMGWIAYLEYEAFARYYSAVGGHPVFNTR